MTIELNVYSEIDPLKEVLVHAPGVEVDVMPPAMMSELLFDDIIYGPRARREHRQFRAILERLGAVTHDLEQLLGEALETAGDEVTGLIAEIATLEGLDGGVVEELRDLPPAGLASTLVHGLLASPGRCSSQSFFRLAPIPNLLFSRDAQVVLGDRLVISNMSHRARQREPILSRFVFRHHPLLRIRELLLDFPGRLTSRSFYESDTTFEGGDLLVFGEGVVIVGVSERTMEISVNMLVERLRENEFFHTLIMVPMPRNRQVMHLDTIFTRTSRDECLVYGPMILSGNRETLSVISIDLRNADDWGLRCRSLLDALGRCGVELTPICCGGSDDSIRQSREQWTDGANSFAVSPGVIMTYSRNEATAEELAKNGYCVVAARDMAFSEDGRCLHEFEPGHKYAILVCGEELSRARGGPRCMTMPLVRTGPLDQA